MTLKVLTSPDLWTTLQKLMSDKGPKHVAVAYLGVDAPRLLGRLNQHDTVVCNASMATLAAGGTSVDALAALLARGVDLRSHPSLHAKIYATPRRVFVGSANASANSARLAEAGVIVDAARQAQELRDYVLALANSPDAIRIDSTFLDWARTVYRPPQGGSKASGSQPSGQTQPLRFVSWTATKAPAGVARAAKQQGPTWRAEADQSAYVDWSWGPKGLWRRDARAVWISREKGGPDNWLANPPAVCMGNWPVDASDAWIYWWRTPDLDPLPWRELRDGVQARTGRTPVVGGTTRSHRIIGAIYEVFGLEPS